MSHDIRHILNQLTAVEEGKLTKAQQSVPQLPALFKPNKISVLGADEDPPHPMRRYAVGADESAQPDQPALAEAMQEVEEDMLSKIKHDFVDYLDSLEKKVSQRDSLRDPETPNLDSLNKKQRIDRDLLIKATSAVQQGKVEEDPTQQELSVHAADTPQQNPTLPESSAVETVAMEDSVVFEIHGDLDHGFEIRRGNRALPTRFDDLDQARIALKLFQRHRSRQDHGQDYIEEK